MKKTTLIAALVALSIPKAKAELMAAKVPDDIEDPAKDEVDAAIVEAKETQKELLKNDKDFVGDLKKQQYALASAQYYKKLKTAFPELKAEDIKDKTTDEVIDIAAKIARSKGDSTAQQLQEELAAAQTELKNLKEVEIPRINNSVEDQKKSMLTEAKFVKLVNSIGKTLRVSEAAAIATLKHDLAEKNIQYGLGEDGELEFFTKSGDTKLKVHNSDKTGFLKPNEIVTSTLDANKLIENSGSGGEGGSGTGGQKKRPDGSIIVEAGGGDSKRDELEARYPGLKAAREHKETLAKEMKASKDKTGE